MPRTIPKITWGTAFANTLTCRATLDDPLTYPLPREGSDWRKSASGVESAYVLGDDQFLTGTVRWIPIADAGGISGWDGATSWRAFIQWARHKNIFRFYPDASSGTFYTMYLVEPVTDPGVQQENGALYRQLRLVMRTSDDTPVTGY